MKQSGGITITRSEPYTDVAITVVFDEGGDVEKIINQNGEIIYESGGDGGGGQD